MLKVSQNENAKVLRSIKTKGGRLLTISEKQEDGSNLIVSNIFVDRKIFHNKDYDHASEELNKIFKRKKFIMEFFIIYPLALISVIYIFRTIAANWSKINYFLSLLI